VEESANEHGTIHALIEQFEKQSLPLLHELKERINKGKTLSNSDIQFMTQVMLDAQWNKQLIDRHPEWQEICAEVIHLYDKIADKTLEHKMKS